MQHLHTPIEAEVEQATHIVDILAEMHPTPAVGGTPERRFSVEALEGIQRGLLELLVGLTILMKGIWLSVFAVR